MLQSVHGVTHVGPPPTLARAGAVLRRVVPVFGHRVDSYDQASSSHKPSRFEDNFRTFQIPMESCLTCGTAPRFDARKRLDALRGDQLGCQLVWSLHGATNAVRPHRFTRFVARRLGAWRWAAALPSSQSKGVTRPGHRSSQFSFSQTSFSQ